MKFRAFVRILLLLMLANNAHAQENDAFTDTLAKHAAWYAAKKLSPTLFVHIDKTVYVNNETIWFSAYLLNAGDNLHRHSMIGVSLINNNSQKVVAEAKFAMQGGSAHGNLMVADTLLPGSYSFVACTNVLINGKPEARFVQPVSLKTAVEPGFNVDVLIDTANKDPMIKRIVVNAANGTTPLPNADINYVLGTGRATRITGKDKTNVIGSATITIPATAITANQRDLEVQVKYATEVKTLHLNLLFKKQVPQIKFYPEGGHLIAGLNNRVGWEAKTEAGKAMKVYATIYAADQPINTIETDSYGMGMFNIIPQAQVKYTVKLSSDGADTVCQLPMALNAGLVAQTPDAVVKDTLVLKMQAKGLQNASVVLHNYKTIFSVTRVKLNNGGAGLKIDLTDIPRGLNTVTILDSLNRPLAERIFFAHHNQKPAINISVDNAHPVSRDKVNVKLKLNSITGKPLQGLVSVAAVQENRFEVANSNNIENYVYLQSQLDDMPIKDDLFGRLDVDKRYLNELLLIRGWSKYNWPEMMATKVVDTLKKYVSPLFTGTLLTKMFSPINKPVTLILMIDSKLISTFDTDSKGKFSLTDKAVYSQFNKTVKLMVSGRSRGYAVDVTNPFKALNKYMASTLPPSLYEQPIAQSTRPFVLAGEKGITLLREVNIRTRFRNGLTYLRGRNECGDYVCKYGFFNCPAHPTDLDNTAPLPGDLVRLPSMEMMLYRSCNPEILQPGMALFKNTDDSKEYYGVNYSDIKQPVVDSRSTVFWKHTLNINSAKDTELSFQTNDIVGKFKIVAQGVTGEDVVYGETTYDVRRVQ